MSMPAPIVLTRPAHESNSRIDLDRVRMPRDGAQEGRDRGRDHRLVASLGHSRYARIISG